MYGLVGMGSFIAATTGAPVMAILMAFELTLDYAILPFLMVNCVVAYYCSGIFERRFMYGESLERKGAAFFNKQLAEVNIQDLVRDPITLAKNATFAQIAETFVQHRFQHIYIVDKEKRLLGAVSLHDVKTFLDRPELESVVIAADIMDEDFPCVSPDQGMSEALHKFSEAKSERLPVVDDLNSQRLIGSISKTDIILHLAGEQSSTGTTGSLQRDEAGFKRKPEKPIESVYTQLAISRHTTFDLWQLFTPFIIVASAIQSFKPKPFTAGPASFQASKLTYALPKKHRQTLMSSTRPTPSSSAAQLTWETAAEMKKFIEVAASKWAYFKDIAPEGNMFSRDEM